MALLELLSNSPQIEVSVLGTDPQTQQLIIEGYRAYINPNADFVSVRKLLLEPNGCSGCSQVFTAYSPGIGADKVSLATLRAVWGSGIELLRYVNLFDNYLTSQGISVAQAGEIGRLATSTAAARQEKVSAVRELWATAKIVLHDQGATHVYAMMHTGVASWVSQTAGIPLQPIPHLSVNWSAAEQAGLTDKFPGYWDKNQPPQVFKILG